MHSTRAAVCLGDRAALAERRDSLAVLSRRAKDLADGQPGLWARLVQLRCDAEARDRLLARPALLQLQGIRAHGCKVVSGLIRALCQHGRHHAQKKDELRHPPCCRASHSSLPGEVPASLTQHPSYRNRRVRAESQMVSNSSPAAPSKV